MNRRFNKKNKAVFLRYLIFLTVVYMFFLQQETIYAQSAINKSYVLGMGGVSKNIKSQKGNLKLQHCIGQKGITGTLKKQNVVLIQGFLYPHIIIPSKNEFSDLEVTLRVLSNTQIYNVEIKDNIQSGFLVELYDLTGRNIYSRFYTNVQSFELNMGAFVSGIYILNISTSTKRFSIKLLK